MPDLKEIQITKTVPVNDLETLTIYLNQEMEKYVEDVKRDNGKNKKTIGNQVLSLIQEAGFHLDAPTITRDRAFDEGK